MDKSSIIPDAFKSVLEKLQEAIRNSEELRESAKNYLIEIEKVPDSQRILADFGWYFPIDWHPAEINYFANELKNGNHIPIDNEMIKYFDDETSDIEQTLVKKYPNRKSPLHAAIKAHNNKEYYLSIPVFLSQIEGICTELTGKRFFQLDSKTKKPITEKWVKSVISTGNSQILKIILEPLVYSGSTRENYDPKKIPATLNRHAILHGDSNDYGENKMNSYKALSLLNYIGNTVFQIKDGQI